jgi:hypothetical protein
MDLYMWIQDGRGRREEGELREDKEREREREKRRVRHLSNMTKRRLNLPQSTTSKDIIRKGGYL